MQTEKTEESAPQFDVGILELLAFTAWAEELKAEEEQVPELLAADLLLERARDGWQESLEVRRKFRARARHMAEVLEDAGLRLRPSDSKQVAKTLEWVKTVPPRAAYGEDEL